MHIFWLTTQSQITQSSDIPQHAAQDCTQRYKKRFIQVVSSEMLDAVVKDRRLVPPPHTLEVTAQSQDLMTLLSICVTHAGHDNVWAQEEGHH